MPDAACGLANGPQERKKLMNLELIHAQSLETSAALSLMQGATMLALQDVIRILNEAKVQFVLIGAHGLAGWLRKPRATQDVDVVVSEKHLKKATRALVAAFPNLEPIDLEVVIRFKERDSGAVAIDVVKPRTLYRQVFKNTHSVNAGGQTYRIPSLEMALAMKFAAMVSPNRADEEKHQDAHDFIVMVKANPEQDREKLRSLGESVYGGGGADLLEMIRQVQAGEPLVL
jgi:hypothetical protein